jgi:hypothetical protein
MSEQLYQAHFHLTGLTSQEYNEVLSNVIKIGKVISFGGGVDNIIEQRTTLIQKIEADLKSLGIDQEKRKKLIDDWKKIIW